MTSSHAILPRKSLKRSKIFLLWCGVLILIFVMFPPLRFLNSSLPGLLQSIPPLCPWQVALVCKNQIQQNTLLHHPLLSHLSYEIFNPLSQVPLWLLVFCCVFPAVYHLDVSSPPWGPGPPNVSLLPAGWRSLIQLSLIRQFVADIPHNAAWFVL